MNDDSREAWPLRSAVEAAEITLTERQAISIEERGYRDLPPVRVQAKRVLIPPPIIIPSEADVNALAACNGGDLEKAFHDLVIRSQAHLKRFAVLCPTVYMLIMADLAEIDRLRDAANEKVREQNDLLQQLRDRLVERATNLRDAAENEGVLSAAKEALADESSADLTGAELAGFQERVKKLPKRIADLRKSAAALEPEIRSLSAKSRTSVEAMMNALSEEAVYEPGIRRLVNDGFMALPAVEAKS
jgi:hypothetical protein